MYSPQDHNKTIIAFVIIAQFLSLLFLALTISVQTNPSSNGIYWLPLVLTAIGNIGLLGVSILIAFGSRLAVWIKNVLALSHILAIISFCIVFYFDMTAYADFVWTSAANSLAESIHVWVYAGLQFFSVAALDLHRIIESAERLQLPESIRSWVSQIIALFSFHALLFMPTFWLGIACSSSVGWVIQTTVIVGCVLAQIGSVLFFFGSHVTLTQILKNYPPQNLLVYKVVTIISVLCDIISPIIAFVPNGFWVPNQKRSVQEGWVPAEYFFVWIGIAVILLLVLAARVTLAIVSLIYTSRKQHEILSPSSNAVELEALNKVQHVYYPVPTSGHRQSFPRQAPQQFPQQFPVYNTF